jgi:hypothetical protein
MSLPVILKVIFVKGCRCLDLKDFVKVAVGRNFPPADSHSVVLVKNVPSHVFYVHLLVLCDLPMTLIFKVQTRVKVQLIERFPLKLAKADLCYMGQKAIKSALSRQQMFKKLA